MSHFLNETQTQRIQAGDGQKPVTQAVSRRLMNFAQCTRILAPPPNAKRPSKVCSCQRSVIRCPTPKMVSCPKNVTVSRGWHAKLRECKAQPAGKEEGSEVQRRKRASAGAEVRTGYFWTSTPPFSHADRSFDVSRWKLGNVAPASSRYENPRRFIKLKWVKERVLPLFEDVKIEGALVAHSKKLLCPGILHHQGSCCRDGSLAVTQSIWAQKTLEVPPMSEGVASTHTCALLTWNAGTSLGRNCRTTSAAVGNLVEKIWHFDYLQQQYCSRRQTDALGPQRHDSVPNTSQRSQHRLNAGFQILSAPKQSGNTRVTCRGVVDKAFADPVVQKRMTGKFMLDVFGVSGFVAQATNQLGVRGYVLDTKFGPRYDVTQPLVLTGIRQHVFAGKCFAELISPPRHHSLCFHKVISASATIANLLHRAREHPCDSWFWDEPRTAWVLSDYCIFGSKCRKRTLFPMGNVDSRDCTVLLANVLERVDVAVFQDKKHLHPKASAQRSEFDLHVTTPAFPIFRACHESHHERAPSPPRMGDYSLNTSKVFGMGVAALRSLVDQSQWLTQCVLQWLAQRGQISRRMLRWRQTIVIL